LADVEFGDARKKRELAEITARAHMNLGHDDLARIYLLRATGVDIESQWANSTACLVISEQLSMEAEGVCNAAFVTAPLDGGLRNALGVYFGRLGDHESAIPYFEAAVALNPQELSYLGNLRSARASAGMDSDQ
jgi:Flp pilus assembly protein TadD